MTAWMGGWEQQVYRGQQQQQLFQHAQMLAQQTGIYNMYPQQGAPPLQQRQQQQQQRAQRQLQNQQQQSRQQQQQQRQQQEQEHPHPPHGANAEVRKTTQAEN
eukprot:TRINITY_DN6667_c0_g1_i1.p1 TRINITY_DN6667_c0_g1~~TRINITY_DN6667_c0_g1_i1.p1  ORF type:complete len:103 (+),score=42.07 TRINITY_DN6667_c0_g1_i1:36-344(+)